MRLLLSLALLLLLLAELPASNGGAGKSPGTAAGAAGSAGVGAAGAGAAGAGVAGAGAGAAGAGAEGEEAESVVAETSVYTLLDSRLNATFRGSTAELGTLSGLAAVGGGGRAVNVITAAGGTSPLWSASFVGVGLGEVSISSSTASCAGGTAVSAATGSQLTFRWIGCTVRTPSPPPSGPPPPSTWIEHAHSNCGGTCLAVKSKAGNCDRQPGCGHHPSGGSANCSVPVMKARCLGAAGCTAFNTNGYLYHGTSIKQFGQYPLQCYTLGGAPPPPPGPAALVNVSVTVTLSRGLLEYDIAFDSDGAVSLWDYTISLPNVATTPSTRKVQTMAAAQLLGLYDEDVSGGQAVYFAAHDPARATKSCSAVTSPERGSGIMQCTILAGNASLPLHHYAASYPIVITVISGGDWWDITQVYRKWVLPNSHWTQLGPLDSRTGQGSPDWLENVTLWVNNNWGSDPLKPLWGGDPAHVSGEMLKLNALLGLPAHGGHLALHWYEWDLLGYSPGSNYTSCDRHPAPCGFDTHYPEYLPARPGCKGAVSAMKEQGMRVIPYINGQLFDVLLPKYQIDKAAQFAAKLSPKTLKAKSHNLTLNTRNFDHISDVVMCPATAYWHGIMRDTMLSIVNDLGFDGVYVDQVGVADSRTIADHHCMDPTHSHSTIGGGSYWAEAYYQIMSEVRARVPPSMFMTEGTIEEMQGPGFDIMLGLKWSELPYWHAIYGGYGYSTGHASQGQPLSTDGLLTQLTAQFMVGGTMGWFTYETYGNQFFLPSNAGKVDYIRRLSMARIVAKRWMVHGRATRSLVLSGDTSAGGLKAGCFLRDEKPAESPSVVCAVASPKESVRANFSLALHPPRFGLIVPDGAAVELTDLITGASYGSFRSVVTHSASLPEFGIALLKLTVKPRTTDDGKFIR
jgi:hypothetical protein